MEAGVPSGGGGGLRRMPSGGMSGIDWRSHMAIEERKEGRKRLRESFEKNCPTYDELLAVISAIDEELIFSTANTRMDYFKTVIDWDNRLAIKQNQMQGVVGINDLPAPESKPALKKRRSSDNLAGHRKTGKSSKGLGMGLALLGDVALRHS